jgi:hypothetical protein
LSFHAMWSITTVVRVPRITPSVQSTGITPRIVTYAPWGSSTTSPVSPTLPASPPQRAQPHWTLKKCKWINYNYFIHASSWAE